MDVESVGNLGEGKVDSALVDRAGYVLLTTRLFFYRFAGRANAFRVDVLDGATHFEGRVAGAFILL